MDRFNTFLLLREKIVSMRVSVRNRSNACVSRKMRESWKVCRSDKLTDFVYELRIISIVFSALAIVFFIASFVLFCHC